MGDQSKRKQQLMALHSILGRLAEATALRQAVRKSQETHDFATALLTCIECAQGLEALAVSDKSGCDSWDMVPGSMLMTHLLDAGSGGGRGPARLDRDADE